VTVPSAALTDDPYIPGTGSAGIVPTHYDLDLTVRLGNNRLTGRAKITGTVPKKTDTLVFDLVGLSVKKVSIKGHDVSKVRAGKDQITITTKSSIPSKSTVTVDVTYEGSPGPRRGPWGEVGWEELTDGVLVAGQPNGAPTWFPCVDHPALKATYDIAVWADAGYRVMANGTLTGTSRKSSSHRWVYRESNPTSTYLVALQIGRYDVVEHQGKAGFASSNTAARRVREALTDQPRMFALFERCFGPYPFEQYTTVVSDDALEIPLEAMEMSLFGINHMTSEWENQRLIAHELAHQWWGNAVTLKQWRDLWLHEGFACYSEWLWAEESGHSTAAIEAHRAWVGLRHKPQDLHLTDPGPDDMFDDRVYKRGALVLHALRTHVGDAEFFSILRAFQDRFRGRTADTQDFLDIVADISGSGARKCLTPWLTEKTVPSFPIAG
jgi:aminopeptidase N